MRDWSGTLKLCVVCVTVITVTVVCEVGAVDREWIRENAKMQVEMFKDYANRHAGGVEIQPGVKL
jgi:hypothetical protein